MAAVSELQKAAAAEAGLRQEVETLERQVLEARADMAQQAAALEAWSAQAAQRQDDVVARVRVEIDTARSATEATVAQLAAEAKATAAAGTQAAQTAVEAAQAATEAAQQVGLSRCAATCSRVLLCPTNTRAHTHSIYNHVSQQLICLVIHRRRQRQPFVSRWRRSRR
jgi:hypothetical protein